MEAAHRHRQAGLEEVAGEVDGVRELVGLHADQADQRLAAGAADVGHDAVGPHPGIGLVERLDQDVDVGAQHLALPAVLAQPVERGQGVGRDVGPQPRDRIAVVVVVRRLDQNQVEISTLLHGTAHRGISPKANPRAALSSDCHRSTASPGHNALGRLTTQLHWTDNHNFWCAILHNIWGFYRTSHAIGEIGPCQGGNCSPRPKSARWAALRGASDAGRGRERTRRGSHCARTGAGAVPGPELPLSSGRPTCWPPGPSRWKA